MSFKENMPMFVLKGSCSALVETLQVTQNYASETHVSLVRRFLSEKREQAKHGVQRRNLLWGWLGSWGPWNVMLECYVLWCDDVYIID